MIKLIEFCQLRCQNNRNLKIYDFLQKLKKVVRIVLYGPAISQSDCRKAGPYQLPSNKLHYLLQETFWVIELSSVYAQCSLTLRYNVVAEFGISIINFTAYCAVCVYAVIYALLIQHTLYI